MIGEHVKGAVIIYGRGAVQIGGGGQKFLCKQIEGGGPNFSANR